MPLYLWKKYSQWKYKPHQIHFAVQKNLAVKQTAKKTDAERDFVLYYVEIVAIFKKAMPILRKY